MVEHALEELNTVVLVLVLPLEGSLAFGALHDGFRTNVLVLLRILPLVLSPAESALHHGLGTNSGQVLVHELPLYRSVAKSTFDNRLCTELVVRDEVLSLHDLEALVALNEGFGAREQVRGGLVWVCAFQNHVTAEARALHRLFVASLGVIGQLDVLHLLSALATFDHHSVQHLFDGSSRLDVALLCDAVGTRHLPRVEPVSSTELADESVALGSSTLPGVRYSAFANDADHLLHLFFACNGFGLIDEGSHILFVQSESFLDFSEEHLTFEGNLLVIVLRQLADFSYRSQELLLLGARRAHVNVSGAGRMGNEVHEVTAVLLNNK